MDYVTEKAPELYDRVDEINESIKDQNKLPEVDIEIIKKIVKWDKKNKVLKGFEYNFMLELAEGKKAFTERNKFIAGMNLNKVRKYGFEE